MFTCLNPQISIATFADIAEITHLLNSAYRGKISTLGWTTEAHLISGNVRTSQSSLQQIVSQPHSVILKYTHPQNQIIGCVNLQQQDDKIYLGMLSVSPMLQGAGIGKQLLNAAEEYANYLHCTTIYMTVITARTELIDWYKRHGYVDTGKRKPFVEDGESGNHLQTLQFMILEKQLTKI